MPVEAPQMPLASPSVNEMSQADWMALYKKFRGDFGRFSKFFFPGFIEDRVPEFHKEIYELLRRENRLVVAAPRGYAKSTIGCVLYPLWCGLLRVRKEIHIISASEEIAVGFLRKVKMEIDTNEKVRAVFGDVRGEKWNEGHIELKSGVSIKARGAGGQSRGPRPDCILLDDIETDESVVSEEQRKKLKEWLFKACLNSLTPDGQIAIFGTIIHPLSVLADLLDMPNGWQKRKFKAYIDGVEEAGKELWPQRFPHAWLQNRKREIGSTAFASEFMNDPKADDTAVVKEHQIRYWENLPSQMSCVIAVDPAYSEDAGADFKVASVVGIDDKGNRYLIEYVRNHAPTGEFQDSILNLYLKHKNYLTGLGVPSGAGGDKEFFNSFMKKCEERKAFPPIQELKNTFRTATGSDVRSKKARITAALQPIFERGQYYIHGSHVEAREELLTIGSSRWDDLVDSLAYAESIIQPVYFSTENRDKWGEPIRRKVDGYGLEY